MSDATLTYGDSYTFSSGGNNLGIDGGRDWAVLTSSGETIQFEGAATSGSILTGYDIYIYIGGGEGFKRFLEKSPEGWLRWSLSAAIDDRAQFQIFNNADSSSSGVAIPVGGPFSLYLPGDGMWVGQESGEEYLELSSTAISFSASQSS